MKLPFDKQYMKVIFHIVVTAVLIYLSYLFIRYFDKIFIAAALLIGTVMTVCAPVFIAFVISYLFDPIVEFFQKKYEEYRISKGKNTVKSPRHRLFGTSTVFVLIVVVFGGLIYVGIMGIIDAIQQAGSPAAVINDYTQNFTNLFAGMQGLFEKFGIWGYVAPWVTTMTKSLTSIVMNAGGVLVSFFSAAGSVTFNIFIGLIVSFYFLNEKEFALRKMREIVDAFLSKRNSKRLNNFIGDIHAVFSGYIRGQMTDALIMSCLLTVSLLILQVPYPLIIGIITGFSNIIPYFGAIIGLILAVTVTLLQGEIVRSLIVAAVIIILQQVDSVFIAPKVVGDKVELHPVVVLITITAAGKLFGLVGMIVAVPIVATVKMFAARYIDRRKVNHNVNNEGVR